MYCLPSDAVKAVKEKVNYVCAEKGGEEAVRDFCEYLIAQQSTDEEPHGFELNEINYELKPYIND
jgi:3-deoxy-D-manno-octulosonate 8-phosphate phosphatase KdsC-like HAD superfamily phosphatase